MADPVASVMNAKGADGDGAVPFSGCICCFASCFTVWPDCIGCKGSSDCLCYHSESIACKLPKEEDKAKDIWCICSRGESVLSPIKNLCATTTQCFCFDYRATLPPTEEIPCMCTVCFFTCFYKYKAVMKFMQPLSELEAAAAAM